MASDGNRGNSIILIVDEDAIVHGSDHMCRIEPRRLQRELGDQWVGKPRALSLPSGEARAPRCTGVLLRNAKNELMMATSAHCFLLDVSMFKKVRCVVGLESIEQPFHCSQELSISGIKHYEDSRDRDLAIWRLRQAHKGLSLEGRGLCLSGEELEVKTGDEVVIVGHPGGRDRGEFRGVVTSVVPPPDQGRLRGFNVQMDEPRSCLSGSPVFMAETGRLLGILQGTKAVTVDDWKPHLEKLKELATKSSHGLESAKSPGPWIREELGERHLLTDVWGNPTPLAEGLDRVFGEAQGAVLRSRRSGLEASRALEPPAADREAALSEILELAQDDCGKPPRSAFVNVVALRGVLSISLV